MNWLLLSWLLFELGVISTAFPLAVLLGMRRLWQLRAHSLIAPRHPSLLLAICACGVVFLLCYQLPWSLLWFLTLSGRARAMTSNGYSSVGWLLLVETPLAVAIFAGLPLWVLRLCLVHCDVEHSLAVSEERWVSVVTGEETPSNFFTEHRHTLGNSRYMLPRTAFASAVVIVVYLVAAAFDWKTARFVRLAMICVPILAGVAIRRRTRPFADRIHLREELSVTNRCLVILLLSVVAFTILYDVNRMVYLWTVSVGSTATGAMMSTVAWWAVRKAEAQHRDSSFGLQVRLGLAAVLSDEAGFRAFMDHLAKEFSCETLLCVLECSQLLHAHGAAGSLGNFVFLPTSALELHSQILAENQTLEGRVVALLEKYVLPGAALCVNVPHRLRVEAQRVAQACRAGDADGVSDWDSLLRETVAELFHVMQDSWHRFRKCDEFSAVAGSGTLAVPSETSAASTPTTPMAY